MLCKRDVLIDEELLTWPPIAILPLRRWCHFHQAHGKSSLTSAEFVLVKGGGAFRETYWHWGLSLFAWSTDVRLGVGACSPFKQ